MPRPIETGSHMTVSLNRAGLVRVCPRQTRVELLDEAALVVATEELPARAEHVRKDVAQRIDGRHGLQRGRDIAGRAGDPRNRVALGLQAGVYVVDRRAGHRRANRLRRAHLVLQIAARARYIRPEGVGRVLCRGGGVGNRAPAGLVEQSLLVDPGLARRDALPRQLKSELLLRLPRLVIDRVLRPRQVILGVAGKIFRGEPGKSLINLTLCVSQRLLPASVVLRLPRGLLISLGLLLLLQVLLRLKLLLVKGILLIRDLLLGLD